MATFSHRIKCLILFQLGLSMGIITMGGGLLIASSNETNETGESNNIHLPTNNPCPDKTNISPCVCSYGDGQGMDMDCSHVTSEEELREVFNQKFSSTNFSTLTISNNKNITILKEGDLGNASFIEIHFTEGVLTTIDSLSLKGSWDTLTSLMLWGNELTSAPDIGNFTRLSYLELNKNKITQFPFLRSKTLKDLMLGSNKIGTIPPNALQGLPLLESFYFGDTSLTEIYSGTFASNKHLRSLDFLDGSLTTIPEDAIRLHGEDTELILDRNQITSLPYEAVSSVTDYLDVRHNQLSELPEKVYRPLLEKNVDVQIYGNPFNCLCDIAWLIENQTLLKKVGDSPSCSNGERFIDLDPEYYKVMCNSTDGI